VAQALAQMAAEAVAMAAVELGPEEECTMAAVEGDSAAVVMHFRP